MIQVYREHPEFGEFTKVDVDQGRLVRITADEYRAFWPQGLVERKEGIQRVDRSGAVLFTGETPATRTRFPRRVYFQLTRNCNLECPFCFIEAGKGHRHVPASAAMEMAEFLGQQGVVEVRLTGGEPTTHPDFFRILRKFRENGVYVSVATNGVMDRGTLERLAEQKNVWLICSVDGNRETHNRYRRGTFDTIINNLRYLKQRNPAQRLRLTTVLTRQNKNQMFDLAEICRSVDAESITVIPLRPQVRNAAILGDMVSAAEFKRVIEDMVAAKQKFGVRFTTTLETQYAGQIDRDPVFAKRSSCAAGREGTNLDYDADRRRFVVYGCSYSPACDLKANPRIRKPFVGGEFGIDDPGSFLDIWRNEQAWTIFRDLSVKWDECRDCRYYTNHVCVGSCPIQNLDYSRIDAGKDVLAQLRERIKGTSEWYCYKAILG